MSLKRLNALNGKFLLGKECIAAGGSCAYCEMKSAELRCVVDRLASAHSTQHLA